MFSSLSNTFQNDKTKSLVTGIGVLGGIFYGVKNHKSMAGIAGYAILFGIGGAILGSVISNITDTQK